MLYSRFKKKILLIIFFTLFLCIIPPCSKLCAEELVRVDQPKIRLGILPGQSQAGIINIENPNPNSQFVQIYLEDWYYLPAADGTKEFVPANSTPLSCASWISFSPAELTLPPFSRGKVNYTVRVPSDVKGGHYAVLFFENLLGQSEIKEGTVNVSFAIKMAALFYIEAAGTVERTGLIENFSLGLQPDNLLLVSAEFNNTSNVDITAGGTFHIMDKHSIVHARGEFNDVYTFPGERAKFTSTLDKTLAKGIYDLILTIDLGKALKNTELGRGPVLIKEAEIEIGENGEVIRVGELR